MRNMNFDSFESLAQVSLVINEAEEALKDKTRNVWNSPIRDVLLTVGGGAAGVAVNMTLISMMAGKYIGKMGWPQLLHILKTIGLGSAKRGLVFLAIPVALMAAGGALLAKNLNGKLNQARERLLQLAVAKLHAVIAALEEETNADWLRADELQRLTVLLREYIRRLEDDLGIVRDSEAGDEDDVEDDGGILCPI